MNTKSSTLHSFKNFTLTLLPVLGLFFINNQSALAGVPESLHYMVSPASCQPVTDTDSSRLKMSNGTWVLKASSNARTAKLYCPVNFYGTAGSFNNIQLWYQDAFNENPGSGFSHHGYVQAFLNKRNRSQSGFSTVASIDSNQGQNGYSYVNNFNISDGPTTGFNYYIEITMYRKEGNSGIAFIGLAIDIQ